MLAATKAFSTFGRRDLGDPFWANVSLLVQPPSLAGGTNKTFVDSSANGFTVTAVGDVYQTADSPVIGGGSAYFDGTGDYLTGNGGISTGTAMDTFTIEGWLKPAAFNRSIFGDMSTTSDTKVLVVELNTSGQIVLYWYDGAIKRCTGSTAMTLNQWNYFAIVVNNNSIAIYVNGTTPATLSGTTTLTNRTQTHNFSVGDYNNDPAYSGFMSDLRVSTVARPITAVPLTPLQPDADTRLLLSMNNLDIADKSPQANSITLVGDAQTSTATPLDGMGSVTFDGSGDYLTLPNDDAFQLGTGNFSIEFWWKGSASGSFTQVVGTFNALGGDTWRVGTRHNNNNRLYFARGDANELLVDVNINDGEWYHVAVVRSSGTITIYLDGVAQTLASGTANDSNSLTATKTLYIGHNPYNNTFINGSLADLRITKGVARYTEAFTPPTKPHPTQ